MAATAPPRSSPLYRAGRKRPADASLESEQRLSKRLDLLHLDSNGNSTRLYIPVDPSSSSSISTNPSSKSPISPTSPPISPISPTPLSSSSSHKQKRRPPPPPAEDTMLVEDTPHRVYIWSLADELADLSSDEESPIFLPDIEKHISKIPKYILQPPELKPTKDNQLVLYSVPSSLTVPEEQDKVRKAILEARQRVRERQASPLGEPAAVVGAGNGLGNGIASALTPSEVEKEEDEMAVEEEDDPDAMEIDG
ncbi:uncharacterized protein EI97DRAFT_244878 [Westerdykella ornata]|uniref:Uncharacterized protein n=1 Tax=Westerdykella ornata TaxID=318751 RepID=A0A6A6JNL1_WESOR|nr:uncharacterized protein EI97DRAFT_244878 [Westerdykella ornata]KAF2278102.1 hypothetical protein EI97DRAFT_244878 [Westerdykella ornata]